MARYIPLQDKLDEIEEQGGRLRRRLDYLKGERDFLVDTLLTRPVKDMEAQRRLLREWDEEIEKLERSIDYLRREKRHRDTGDVDDLELPDGDPSPQELAEQSDTRAAVRRGLDRLSPEHRQVLLLRYMQELDYGEIAQVLDVSEGTVKSRINRAKLKLRELLGGGNFFAGTAVLPTEERERRERP